MRPKEMLILIMRPPHVGAPPMFREEDFDVGQKLTETYSESKFAAERLIDDASVIAAIKTEQTTEPDGDWLLILLQDNRQGAGGMGELAREMHGEDADHAPFVGLLPIAGISERTGRGLFESGQDFVHCVSTSLLRDHVRRHLWYATLLSSTH